MPANTVARCRGCRREAVCQCVPVCFAKDSRTGAQDLRARNTRARVVARFWAKKGLLSTNYDNCVMERMCCFCQNNSRAIAGRCPLEANIRVLAARGMCPGEFRCAHFVSRAA